MSQEVKLSPWIETYTGKHFYFLDPTEDMVDIEDIAHSLSRQCRFGGHCSKFLSVAEHSVNVGIISNDHLGGLLHDASEAYLVDIPSPVKQYLSGYKEIEAKVMSVIAKKFGFAWPLTDDVHDADAAQLKAEAFALLPSQGKGWSSKYPTELKGLPPKCLKPEISKEIFLGFFTHLMKVRNEANA